VAIGASYTISVTLTLSASGIGHATLSVSDSGPGASQSVFLTGIGVALALTLFPSSLSFGGLATGTTSAVQTINVSNAGPGSLIITHLAITGADAGDFAQTRNCGSSVAARKSCAISVTFTPVARGSRVAAITITDNAGIGTQTVSLTGTGAGPSAGSPGTGNPSAGVSLSPAGLSYATQPDGTTSAAQTITLSNGTGATLNIAGLAFTGTNAGDFAEIANTCGASVAAGGTCTIGVTFTPSGSGKRTARLNITDNAS